MKEIIKNLDFDHNLKYPKEYYNKAFKFNKSFAWIENKVSYYLLIKKTNPETFEYGALSTTVEIYPEYTTFYGVKSTWIYISTVDDSSLNLKLKLLSKSEINKIINYFQTKKVLHSCTNTYLELSKLMNWIHPKDYFELAYVGVTNKYTGKTKYINNLPEDCKVLDLDFN